MQVLGQSSSNFVAPGVRPQDLSSFSPSAWDFGQPLLGQIKRIRRPRARKTWRRGRRHFL
ncbi:hypothetical protein JB92DRAFT_3011302, partial [Gautieria morchelliformis]